MFRYYLIPVLAILSFACCTDRQTLEPIPFDRSQLEYFPLVPGKSLEYRIDSIVFDPAPGGGTLLDSSTTFRKITVGDSIYDNTGQLQYVLEWYERPSPDQPWAFKFNMTASRNEGQAIWTEENFRFLKLIFPLDTHSEWNGNLWIDPTQEIEIAGERVRPFTNWHYEVDSLDVPGQVGNFSFDSLLVVTEADDANVIERRFSRSWYAKHVGLVRREQWILDSQYCTELSAPPDCETLPWEFKAEKGYILRQWVTAIY